MIKAEIIRSQRCSSQCENYTEIGEESICSKLWNKERYSDTAVMVPGVKCPIHRQEVLLESVEKEGE